MSADDPRDVDPTDWDSGRPLARDEGTGQNAGNAIQFSWWNLLLALPLLMLITSVFNKDEPRVLGLPVFYWYQFGFVFVGVGAVAIVYAATKDRGYSGPKRPVRRTGELDGPAE